MLSRLCQSGSGTSDNETQHLLVFCQKRCIIKTNIKSYNSGCGGYVYVQNIR